MIRNILEYLERSESRYPDKTAFADEGASCTYAELKMRARAVGTCLAQKVSPRMPVPVLMEKSVNAIYSFMGAV